MDSGFDRRYPVFGIRNGLLPGKTMKLSLERFEAQISALADTRVMVRAVVYGTVSINVSGWLGEQLDNDSEPQFMVGNPNVVIAFYAKDVKKIVTRPLTANGPETTIIWIDNAAVRV